MRGRRSDPSDPIVRLGAAERALRELQGQVAALENLSEQLSLSVHTLESELAAIGEHLRSAPEPAPEPAVAQGAAVTDTLPIGHEEPPSDHEGARLVALDMALAGSTRDEVRVALEQSFDVVDVETLLDDVFAAIGR